MAATPPAINGSNNAIMNAATTPAKTTTLAAAANPGHRTHTPTKSQCGHNKPKCRQCGNVARSRCPFESCKSCCSRSQNPCHIHEVQVELHPLDSSPTFFAQFNNLHVSLRSRKPLTRKDAAAINKWRFSKLKEYKERNIEVENEAFDRYMHNVELREEVLSVKSMEDNVSSALDFNPSSTGNSKIMVRGLKLLLRSNLRRSNSVRKRIQQIVVEGLKKLRKCSPKGDEEPNKTSKWPKVLRTERLSAISDLIDKINKARSEEDLKSCSEMKSQLFNLDKGSSKTEFEDNEAQKEQAVESDLAAAYSLPKLVGAVEFDQETLNTIDKHLCFLEHLEQL